MSKNDIDEEKMELVRHNAEAGEAMAQYMMGLYYRDEKGSRSDCKEAVQWFIKSAEQGYAPAMRTLAKHYSNGKGIKKDPVASFKICKVLAERGEDPKDEYILATKYKTGDGVPCDINEAIKWFEISANADYLPSVLELVVIFTKQGLYTDECKKWVNKGAEMGNSHCLALAEFIKSGDKKYPWQ